FAGEDGADDHARHQRWTDARMRYEEGANSDARRGPKDCHVRGPRAQGEPKPGCQHIGDCQRTRRTERSHPPPRREIEGKQMSLNPGVCPSRSKLRRKPDPQTPSLRSGWMLLYPEKPSQVLSVVGLKMCANHGLRSALAGWAVQTKPQPICEPSYGNAIGPACAEPPASITWPLQSSHARTGSWRSTTCALVALRSSVVPMCTPPREARKGSSAAAEATLSTSSTLTATGSRTTVWMMTVTRPS